MLCGCTCVFTPATEDSRLTPAEEVCGTGAQETGQCIHAIAAATAATAAVVAAAATAVAAAAPAAVAAIATSTIAAAAAVLLLLLSPSPACAMLHAMLHAILYARALGALGSSGSCVACMRVRVRGKGRMLWAGSSGSRALVLTCTAKFLMINLIRESSSWP